MQNRLLPHPHVVDKNSGGISQDLPKVIKSQPEVESILSPLEGCTLSTQLG